MGGLAVTFAAFKTADFFGKHIDDAIKFGDSLYHASQRAGHFKPEQFLLIQKALQNVGLGADEARSKIEDFVSNGKRIDSIFGGEKKYGEALRNAAAQYGQEAKVFGDNAARFSKVFESLQAVGEKMRTFFGVMTAQFLKPMQALLETIQQVDLGGTAEKFGKYIADAINILNGFIKNGGWGEAIGLSLEIGFKEALNFLAGGLAAAADALGMAIIKIFSSPELFIGLGKALIGLGAAFGAAILKGLEAPLATIQGAIEWLFVKISKLTNAGGAAGAAFSAAFPGLATLGRALGNPDDNRTLAQTTEDARKNGLSFGTLGNTPENIVKGALDVLKEGTEEAKNSLVKMGPELLAALRSFKPSELYDTKEARDALKSLIQKMREAGVSIAAGTKDKLTDPTAVQLEKPSPFKVIADSLARVGGGGGFIRASMSIAERAQLQTARATQESARLLAAIHGQLSTGPRASGMGH